MKLTKNDSVVITGAASGMGESVARTLAQSNAMLYLVDKNAKSLEKVAAELSAKSYAMDVSSAHDAERLFEEVANSKTNLRLLVNCAGIAPAKRMVSRSGVMPLSQFESVIQVNLVGAFNFMRLAANLMSSNEALEDNERGLIINTASVAAYEGQIGQTAYSASKGGLVSMTLPAARELASLGIRVNTIAPGLMRTPLLLNMPEDVQSSLAASVPFPKRFGNPSEFSALVMHIVENTLINGEVIRLDGAIRMQAK